MKKYEREYAVPDGSEAVRIHEEDGTLRLEWLVAGQTAAESPLRFVGDDLATLKGLGLTVFTDFVRDDAGQVAWIRFIGRLVPRAA